VASNRFCITDVFAEGPYAGNQLATVFDAFAISSEEMQQIAREFNFSETTFVGGGSSDAGFDVRIFTPTTELPFAGHPTLGTAFLLRDAADGAAAVTLNLGVGKITVTFGDDGVLWMRQVAPDFRDEVAAADVAAELGIDVAGIRADAPCQIVSTGIPFLMVPLVSHAELVAARPGGGSLSEGLLVFAPDGYTADQQLGCRMFARELGVGEDPATGSANGCLAAYLRQHALLGDGPVDILVGQGYEIGRPSQLYLRARLATDGGLDVGEAFRVEVGGRTRLVAEGMLQR
jgi:trans-2,3-dihydro-3-hydroxyanthranilate isomerase